MSENAVGKRSPRVRDLRVERTAIAVLLATSIAACGESDGGIRPPMPGTIVLTTETSGFMKDDSYELLVDGESKGTVGANDEVTLAELDPATYEVTLGDVAENCTVEAATVEVVAEETATVSLVVVCEAPDPTNYTVRWGRERPDLDTGVVHECPFSICDTDLEWDFHVYNSSSQTPSSVIRQNQDTGVEIAHLVGVTLATLTEEDVDGATYTTDWVADSFDAGRVILIKTDVGNVFALGNPTEANLQQTLTFDAQQVGSTP